MTYQESGKIVTMLSTAYPSMRGDEKAVVNQVALWADMFPHDDYAAVKDAVRGYIATDEKGFPPKIGQIKARIKTSSPTAIHKDLTWMLPYLAKMDAKIIAKYGSKEAWEAHAKEAYRHDG